jgi:Flp pilus assembly protein TadG
MRNAKHQRGQTLALLALAVIGLVGFAAVAVDGGQIYADRRRAQSAADNAAMTAALARLSGQDWEAAGLAQAAVNGFDPASDPMVLDVEVFSPPAIEPFASDAYRDQYIQVTIIAQVRTVFAHLVFGGPIRNTVTAIARGRPRDNPAGEHALFGTSTDECRTIWFSGSGEIDIHGGHVFSNSDGTEEDPACESGYRGGSAMVHIYDKDFRMAGYYYDGGVGGSMALGTGHIVEGVQQEELFTFPPLPCPGTPVAKKQVLNKDATLSPGNYSDITVNAGANVTMQPGLYCVDGNFTINGGSVTGHDIIIKMVSGSFSASGNAVVDMTAPTTGSFRGLLFYATSAVPSISLNGDIGSGYIGTVYAPYSACTINGSAGVELNLSSQVICRTIRINGDGIVNLEYDRSNAFQLPPMVELAH